MSPWQFEAVRPKHSEIQVANATLSPWSRAFGTVARDNDTEVSAQLLGDCGLADVA